MVILPKFQQNRHFGDNVFLLDKFRTNSLWRDFQGCLLAIPCWIHEMNRWRRFKIAYPIWRPKTSAKTEFSKNQVIWTEFGSSEVFRQLIMTLFLNSPNSRWRIQYGGLKQVENRNVRKIKRVGPNLVHRRFLGSWSWLCFQIYQIKDGGSNMAA